MKGGKAMEDHLIIQRFCERQERAIQDLQARRWQK